MSTAAVLTRTARKGSTCPTCREAIEPGEKIARREFGPLRWSHARCVVTWLRSGRTCRLTGAYEFVGVTADGERVGSNLPGIAEAVAQYAPERPEATR